MKVLLCDAALPIINDAMVTGDKIQVTKYRLGARANFWPDTTDITDVVDFVAEGESEAIGDAVISVSITNETTCRFTLTISEMVGPELGYWEIGNILLMTEDGTPFLFGVLRAPHNKYRTDDPEDQGGRVSFMFDFRWSNVATIVNVNVVLPNTLGVYGLVQAPIYGTQVDVPDTPSLSTSNLVIGTDFTFFCRSFIAWAKNRVDKWIGTGFTQYLKDHRFGEMIGGVVGDNYNQCPNLDFGMYQDMKGDPFPKWESLDLGSYDATAIEVEELDLGTYPVFCPDHS